MDATRNCADTLDEEGLCLVLQRLKEALQEAFSVFKQPDSPRSEDDFSYLSEHPSSQPKQRRHLHYHIHLYKDTRVSTVLKSCCLKCCFSLHDLVAE